MPNNKTVCAIIPTYNRAGYIKECVDSLLSQTRAVDEIIIINDGSTDNTGAVIAEYGDKVRYIEKENGGKSTALNLALSKTESDYIWICDDDDYAAIDGLEHLLKALESDHNASYAFGAFKRFQVDQKGIKIEHIPQFWKREEEPNFKINFLEDMFTFQFAMLVKRSIYQDVGEFSDELIRSVDYNMALRISRKYSGAYTPQTIFYQREHDGERGGVDDKFKKSESMNKWLAYDRIFFKEISDDYDIFEFTPTFAQQWDAPLKLRASLIERALVLAKRGLWLEAAIGFEEALNVSNSTITKEELHICEVVIHNPIAWLELIKNKEARQIFRRCYKGSSNGKILITALCRAVIWMAKNSLKQRDMRNFISYLCLLFSILGVKGTYDRMKLTLKNLSLKL